MVSNIPFGSYQPEWKDYLKTYCSIFGWKFRKVTLPFYLPPAISEIFCQMVSTPCSSVDWNQEGWQTLIQSETCWDAQDHGILIKTSYLDLYVINWNHSRPQDRKKLNTHFKPHHKHFQVFMQTNFLNHNFPCTYYMAPFNKLPQILTNLNTAQLAWL